MRSVSQVPSIAAVNCFFMLTVLGLVLLQHLSSGYSPLRNRPIAVFLHCYIISHDSETNRWPTDVSLAGELEVDPRAIRRDLT